MGVALRMAVAPLSAAVATRSARDEVQRVQCKNDLERVRLIVMRIASSAMRMRVTPSSDICAWRAGLEPDKKKARDEGLKFFADSGSEVAVPDVGARELLERFEDLGDTVASTDASLVTYAIRESLDARQQAWRALTR
jgi:hypothetical protein